MRSRNVNCPWPSGPRGRESILLFALMAAGAANTGDAIAQDAFSGAWKIENSEPAPWAKTADMLDAKEIKRLVGAAVEFKANAISGPAPLACKRPHYALKQFDADMLFQGALAEYGDPSTTPVKMAEKIGFAKRPVTSLETGCEIDFHAIDADHVVFALNNSLYRMTRASGAGK